MKGALNRRPSTQFSISDFFLFVFMVIYILVAPFNKVEEQFNTQAIHDIVFLGGDLSQYDHFDKLSDWDASFKSSQFLFPSVVPRTFIGPIILSFLVLPLRFLGKRITLFFVRFALGCLNCVALSLFSREIRAHFPKTTSTIFVFFELTQFHLLFYMSRTLPNTFAFFFVTLSIVYALRDKYYHSLCLLAFTSVVFRSEVVAFAIPFLGLSLLNGKMKIKKTILIGIIASLVSITLTILVDTFFWGRMIWPEGEVFVYNTFLNKSSNWGVSSYHWYFTNALPKMLLSAFPLSLIGFLSNKRIRILMLSALAFVALYSLLPHKELRFVFYVYPLFNASAAIGVNDIVNSKQMKKNKKLRIVLSFIISFVVGVSFCVSSVKLFVSSSNYPGAQALISIIDNPKSVSKDLHINVCYLASQTGVNRFLVDTYTVQEGEITEVDKYTHFIVEPKEINKLLLSKFTKTQSIFTYKGIKMVPLSELLSVHKEHPIWDLKVPTLDRKRVLDIFVRTDLLFDE